MNPKTTYRTADALEFKNLDEAIAQVEKEKFEQDSFYVENVELKYIAEASEFELDVEGRQSRFSKTGLLEFLGTLGIPAGFAEKLPNRLICTNANAIIDGAQSTKVKAIYRGAVIVGAFRSNRTWVHPTNALESLREGMKARNLTLDRLFVTNDGVVADTYETPVARFDLGDDPFDVGIALDYAFSTPGLLRGGFFSKRHKCLNTAYATSLQTMRRSVTFERLRGTEVKSSTFGRFHEKLTAPSTLLELLHAAHKRLQTAKMTDVRYLSTYRRLAKILGKEPCLQLMAVSEDRHKAIEQVVKARTALKISNPTETYVPEEIAEIQPYELFNRITDAGKGFKGEDRLALETVGGTLLDA